MRQEVSVRAGNKLQNSNILLDVLRGPSPDAKHARVEPSVKALNGG